jgi:hypothetical protein
MWLFGCRPEPKNLHQEELNLYGEAFDGIIAEYCRSHCTLESNAELVEKTNEAFYNKKIDIDEYNDVIDSLFASGKTQLPKCIMEHSLLFGISFR